MGGEQDCEQCALRMGAAVGTVAAPDFAIDHAWSNRLLSQVVGGRKEIMDEALGASRGSGLRKVNISSM